MKALSRFTVKYPWPVIVAFVLISLGLGFGATKLELEASVLAMLPDGAEETLLAERIGDIFGVNAVMVAMVEGDVYTPEGIAALTRLTAAAERAPGVTSVTSAGNAQRMEDDDGFLLIEDLFPAQPTVDDIAVARAYLESSPMYRGGLLISEDGSSANVVIQVDASVDSQIVIDGIRGALTEHWEAAGLGATHLVGGPLLDGELRNTLAREMPLLGGVAALLILVMLFLNFRTTRGALLPLMSVVVGLVWSLGLMGWLGAKLSTLSMIAPVAILAVGSSFSLHLLGRFYQELAHGTTKEGAIQKAFTETGLGVLISGLAISAALTTFVLSGMPTVRTLGLLTAGGVLATLISAMLLLPAVLELQRLPKRVIDPEAPGAIGGFLRWVANLVIRQRTAILIISAALLGVAIFGATRIVPNTAVIDYFATDSPMRKDYTKVEEAFGASSQIQVLVEGDLGDPATLQAMLDFQDAVAEIEGMGPATSIATILRAIHWTLTGEEALPTTREGVAQELLIYQLSGDPSTISSYMTLDSSMGLIDLATTSPSTAEMRRMQNAVEAAADAILAPHAELSYTGTSLIQLAVEDSLLHDFLISLSLAILLVIIIDSFVRSVRAAVVTILALLLTIALQYGLLGVLSIPLDLSTMLLGALAIGVGDYAIHLTVRYMEERRLARAPELAMTNAILSSGRSILFTALTLGAGFASMIVSQFVPVSTLGTLMTFTVISVGTASLTLLPAACLVFLRNPPGAKNPTPATEVTHA